MPHVDRRIMCMAAQLRARLDQDETTLKEQLLSLSTAEQEALFDAIDRLIKGKRGTAPASNLAHHLAEYGLRAIRYLVVEPWNDEEREKMIAARKPPSASS